MCAFILLYEFMRRSWYQMVQHDTPSETSKHADSTPTACPYKPSKMFILDFRFDIMLSVPYKTGNF